MALTYTPPGNLDSACPEFTLKSVDGQTWSLKDFADARALLVMFICNHCPYVKAIESRLLKLASEVRTQGVGVVAICSNDPTDHPEDRPDQLLSRWREKKYGFPYLIDETQQVAKAFGAVCTPDLFVYNHQRKLYYRGRLDDSWKNPNDVRQQELGQAIEDCLARRPIPKEQISSMGCSIKWRS